MTALKISLVAAIPILIALEVLISYLKGKVHYEKRDTRVNLLIALINIGGNSLFKIAAFAFFCYISKFSFVSYSRSWSSWLVAYLLFEFIGYWIHRWLHTYQLLWAIHIVHHSSDQYNFSVALRTNMIQYLMHFLHFPAMLFGITPLQFFVMYYVNNFITLLFHTKIFGGSRLWEVLFVSPRLHQIHHAYNDVYLDKNYGYTLIIFDRLFGTYQPYSEPIKVGITTGKTSNKYFHVQLDELVKTIKACSRIKGILNKLKFCFSKPELVAGLIRLERFHSSTPPIGDNHSIPASPVVKENTHTIYGVNDSRERGQWISDQSNVSLNN